jgi:peptidoglycan/LPS O-acetylase OafA/YrhL
MKLSDVSQSRDNNFNLIRIVAALAVLVTHSFAISTGARESEPFLVSLGMTMGSVAVDVFFITSGFLVTSSLLNRQSTIEFVWARVLRIYPALIVMLGLTVFVIGPLFTVLPLTSYFLDFRTSGYLLKCAFLVSGVVFRLPGVFENNPYQGVVNGSLWTMPMEMRLYITLAVLWFVLRFMNNSRLKAFKISIIILALISCILVLTRNAHFLHGIPKYSFMFFTGSAFYVLRDYIRISNMLFLSIVICLFITINNKHIFFFVYHLTIAYLLIYLAYVPAGFIRKYNLLGDYSYGTYIYAFPIQQSIAALIPGISTPYIILITVPVTILLSAISWHILEKRALSLKGNCAVCTRRLLPLRSSVHLKT